jgi:hypothetical protein
MEDFNEIYKKAGVLMQSALKNMPKVMPRAATETVPRLIAYMTWLNKM